MTTPPNPSIPPLTPREVHVWQFSLEVDPSALAALWQILSADERQRAERFIRPEHRRRFVVARANLRHLLGQYAGIPADGLQLAYGSTGKPELSGGGWHFNVSHSGDQALIAVALQGKEGGGAVGIDLEKVQPLDYEAVGRGVFAEADLLTLSRAPASAKADVFFRLWVRHEARAKAVGAGVDAHAEVPVYDLDVGPEYRGALATSIKPVRIEMLNR
jgi:4'-phosphopantetheinyl transferase